MSKRHSAVIQDPAVEVLMSQGEADAKQANQLDEEISFAQAKMDAIKTLQGGLTFQVLDTERKDENGKVVPLTVTVDAETSRLARALMAMQGKIVDRWRTAEETISDHPVFDAPRCYEERNSDSGKALKLFLQKANSHWSNAQETIAKYAGKKGLTDGESALLGGARYQMERANRVISNVIGVLYEHYKNRTTKVDQVNPQRPGKTLDALVDALVNTCTKKISSKKTSPKEKERYQLVRDVLIWTRIEPKAVQLAWQAFEKERTAKSQQDQKKAQESTQQPAAQVPEAKAALDAEQAKIEQSAQTA